MATIMIRDGNYGNPTTATVPMVAALPSNLHLQEVRAYKVGISAMICSLKPRDSWELLALIFKAFDEDGTTWRNLMESCGDKDIHLHLCFFFDEQHDQIRWAYYLGWGLQLLLTFIFVSEARASFIDNQKTLLGWMVLTPRWLLTISRP
jgi:hypothetical protein